MLFPRDPDVGRDRVIDRIIKTSLDLHTSDRNPDHRVCALALPTTATSIRSNTSDERYSPRSKLGEILDRISTRGGGLLDGIIIKRSRSAQIDQVALGGSKGRIRSRFGLGATGAGLIPRRASQELPPGLGRDLGRGRRRLRLRMQRASSIASNLSPGSLSGFPEDLIVMPARIILSSEIDVSGKGRAPSSAR